MLSLIVPFVFLIVRFSEGGEPLEMVATMLLQREVFSVLERTSQSTCCFVIFLFVDGLVDPGKVRGHQELVREEIARLTRVIVLWKYVLTRKFAQSLFYVFLLDGAKIADRRIFVCKVWPVGQGV